MLLLEYDGTAFFGSQRQPGRRTVAGVLQDAVNRIDPAAACVSMAGRTDAGVHATGQVAACRTTRSLTPDRWRRALNALLPADVGVRNVTRLDDLDVRRDATRRRYDYQLVVSGSRPVLGRHYRGWWRTASADAASEAVSLLAGRHDFRAFCLGSPEPPERTLDRADLQVAGTAWTFSFEARSFLTRQVRLMVGGVMAVATGSLTLVEFRRMIDSGQRSSRLVAAPACGLYLTEVSYPDLLWPDQGGQT